MRKTEILLELIKKIQIEEVEIKEFFDKYKLGSHQKVRYLNELRKMKLDIHIGDSYDRKRKIILKSDRNIDVVTAILEKKLGNIKVKYKSSKENNYKRVAVKEIIFPNPNDFSQDHLKNLIIDLDGENKSKNEILLELEKGIKPKTYEQKNKIVTAYDSWRSEYLKSLA